MEPDPSSGKFHRALGEEHRVRMVDELRRAPNGLDVQRLSDRLGLHPNTIRWHLDVLADAAIVSSRPEERDRPGRPRILYTLGNQTDAGDSRPPGRRLGEDEARQEVSELQAAQGFRPEQAGNEIRLHHCPYRELAPGIVCAVHLGLITGALAELGGGLELERLDPLVEAELCVARLRSSPPAA